MDKKDALLFHFNTIFLPPPFSHLVAVKQLYKHAAPAILVGQGDNRAAIIYQVEETFRKRNLNKAIILIWRELFIQNFCIRTFSKVSTSTQKKIKPE